MGNLRKNFDQESDILIELRHVEYFQANVQTEDAVADSYQVLPRLGTIKQQWIEIRKLYISNFCLLL